MGIEVVIPLILVAFTGYVIVVRPWRKAAKHAKFMKAVEDLTRQLDTEVAPAAQQMSEAMQSFCDATQRIGLNLEGQLDEYMFKER